MKGTKTCSREITFGGATQRALRSAGSLLGGSAYADPIYTLSFSGTSGGTGSKVAYGTDGLDLSGGGNLAGDAYAATITFDPLKLATDSCGSASDNYCTWEWLRRLTSPKPLPSTLHRKAIERDGR